MALPTQLNATEQDTLVKQIGLSLLRAAPRDWRRVTAEYRAVGRYHELTGEVVTSDGTTQEWMATHDIATLFGRLRAGMYREGRGTWFNARYQLDHPSSYNLEYDRDEPHWDLAPPPQAYADELRMFPRSEDNVPDWLMRRMSGLGPERPGPRFRMARIFDGVGPNGPVINRPELDVEEQDRMLDYLDGAPVVVPGRGYDIDRLANTPESTVPIAFHSDGTWIWPAAVNYYLREYGVAPEPDLLQHIHANGFAIPDVADPVRQAAAAHITRGQGMQQRPTPPPPPPPAPEPVVEDVQHDEEPPFDAHFDEHAAERTRLAEPARFEEPRHFDEPERFDEPEHFDDAQRADERESDDYDTAEHAATSDYVNDREHYERDEHEDDLAEQGTTFTPVPGFDNGAPTTITPAATAIDVNGEPQLEPLVEPHLDPEPPIEDEPFVPPSQQSTKAEHLPARAALDDDGGPPTQFSMAPAPPMHDDPELDDLQEKLDELGVPQSAYRIGEPTERGWSIEEVPEGWRVGWYDDGLKSPAVFGDAADATAFMLGKLMLAPAGVGEVPHAAPPPPPAPPAQPPSPAPVPEDRERQAAQAQQAPSPARPMMATLSPEVATGVRQPPPVREGAQPDVPARPAPPRDEPQGGRRAVGGAAIPAASGGLPQREAPPAPPAPPAAPTPPRREPRPAEQAESRSGGGGGQQWPIQPMSGEPPLTLFRGKELQTLPVGSELDRFGGANGNLTYAAGTPFEERSLVPEWISRPYHLYRVQRPLEALHGVAIPWFNQPGGGAAYLLPATIEELLAEGDLIELDPGEPPID
ncbi:TNT domain-containing protein [Prauserella cavernicola]|uniref:TNT domain-containing protein n=1 Tax=Prauserella cavernicola TaxID=2800127 RepID=UPI0027DC679E|nr:TNT domain-containing protein [Prauserella cavernicola]